MKTTFTSVIRPVFAPAFETQQATVTKANDIKIQATNTLRDVVVKLWEEHKKHVKANVFRDSVIEIVADHGYTDAKQWATKFLVRVDEKAFRQRAERSNKGGTLDTLPKALNEKQIAFEVEAIRHVAARLKLTGDIIEKLVMGLIHENEKLVREDKVVSMKKAA